MPSQSHIFVLGGSGRVGQQLINDALSKGYHVTALVRKPNSIPPRPDLNLITGSPTSTPDILKALTSISSDSTKSRTKVTIISTLGQTRSNPSNPWSTPTSPPLYMTQSINALTSALKTIYPSRSSLDGSLIPSTLPLPNFKITKLIVLSMFGAADSQRHMHWSLRWVMAHSNMRQTLEDHDQIIRVLQENYGGCGDGVTTRRKLPVPFVAVRPVMLKFPTDLHDEEVPKVREWGNGEVGMGVTLGCDVRSLSEFLLERVRDSRLDGRMPVIST